MMNNLLLPHKYKKLGWIILVPVTILGMILIFSDFEALAIQAKVFAILNDEFLGKKESFSIIQTNITNTIIGILFIVGALLVSFSKEKVEDEFIAKLRQTSLLWAVLVNYILLLFAFMFIYGSAFFNVMLYNMFTILIIFIIRFNYVMYRNSKSELSEKYN